MKCPKCNNEIDDDAVFCEFCGAGIKGVGTKTPDVGEIAPMTVAAIAAGVTVVAAIIVFVLVSTSRRTDVGGEPHYDVISADSTAVTEECALRVEPAEEAETAGPVAEEPVAAEQKQPRPESAAERKPERRTEESAPTDPETERAAAAAAEKAAAERAARQREESKTLYYNAANGLYKAGRYEEAVTNFRRAAECGSTAAASMLGYCYYAGTGVSKNPDKALEWWRSAAADNHAYSIYMIGYCYYSGTGVEQDFDEALRWLRRAESLGFADAREIIDDIARISAGL